MKKLLLLGLTLSFLTSCSNIDEAPAISKEFIKLIKSDKIKPYTKAELFSNFYRVIERGWSDKKLNEALIETKERIDSLEMVRSYKLN